MKSLHWKVGLTVILFLAGACSANADEDLSNPEEKAEHAHQLSMSDVVYQQEDFRALYYQNEAIIQLLKEVRDEIHAVNLRDAKEVKKA